MTRVTGSTRVFAVLGQPVAHSLSPAMHNAVFHTLGLNATYVALPCDAQSLPGLMRALAAAGGGGNVTVPHKAIAAETVDRLDGPAHGACNTFWGEEGRLVGDNTDVQGILAAMDAFHAPSDGWLVLGTGGSARAVLAAARERGVAVSVRSRSAERREAFLAEAAAMGLSKTEAAACGVVVNATPLGLRPDDPLPVAPAEVPSARFALDLVYGRGGTRWILAMQEAGVRGVDGREVLVAQGAAAFRRWFPRLAPPMEIMRAAVRDALE